MVQLAIFGMNDHREKTCMPEFFHIYGFIKRNVGRYLHVKPELYLANAVGYYGPSFSFLIDSA